MIATIKSKDYIRRYAVVAKSSIGSGLAQRKNAAAVSRLLAHPAYCSAKNILAYFPVENEIDISEALESAVQEHKKVAYPVWDGHGGIIAAVPLDDRLEIDRYGAVEPTLFHAEILIPSEIDLILVPGLAFDTCGHRIGWGGGHYGRYMPLCKKAYCLGVAFEEQMIPEIDVSDADATVDSVLTDCYVYESESS